MFCWEELGSKMRMRVTEFHSRHLVGKSPISIPILEGNMNTPIHPKLNPNSSLVFISHSNANSYSNTDSSHEPIASNMAILIPIPIPSLILITNKYTLKSSTHRQCPTLLVSPHKLPLSSLLPLIHLHNPIFMDHNQETTHEQGNTFKSSTLVPPKTIIDPY